MIEPKSMPDYFPVKGREDTCLNRWNKIFVFLGKKYYLYSTAEQRPALDRILIKNYIKIEASMQLNPATSTNAQYSN